MAAQSIPPRPVPRLYLATPVVSDPAAILKILPDMLGAADIAAMLLRLAPADERTIISRIKMFAQPVQSAGVALLLDGHAELVARGGADGAHLSGLVAMNEVLSNLKPDRIAGVGGLETRHDAMMAGEAGADYVLFGEPDETGVRPSTDAVAERLAWWAEVFEVPCVGYAASFDEAGRFARAGADFILVGDLIWNDASAPHEALVKVQKIIADQYALSSEAAVQ